MQGHQVLSICHDNVVKQNCWQKNLVIDGIIFFKLFFLLKWMLYLSQLFLLFYPWHTWTVVAIGVTCNVPLQCCFWLSRVYFLQFVNAFPPQGSMDNRQQVSIKLKSFLLELQHIIYSKPACKQTQQSVLLFSAPPCVHNVFVYIFFNIKHLVPKRCINYRLNQFLVFHAFNF